MDITILYNNKLLLVLIVIGVFGMSFQIMGVADAIRDTSPDCVIEYPTYPSTQGECPSPGDPVALRANATGQNATSSNATRSNATN